MGYKEECWRVLFQYSNRILNSSLWKNTKDISQWDLSTDGAKS